jgi:hypothetical protein
MQLKPSACVGLTRAIDKHRRLQLYRKGTPNGEARSYARLAI